MFQTLELQYLNKLIEGKVRDFSAPQPLHRIKVQHLGYDRIKPSAEVSGKFPVPILALVGNFAIKPCEFTDSTPPIARTFHFTTDGFIEFTELVQGVFQGLRVVYLLTRVSESHAIPIIVMACLRQGQIRLHSGFDLGIDQIHSLYYIVCAYAFTCSGQDFFSGVICHDGQPKCSDSISTDLDITDVSLPIAVVVIQDIATFEHKLFFDGIPFLEGQANRAFGNDRRFTVLAFLKNLVSCLKLRRTVFFAFLELRGTDTPTAPTLFNPIKEPFVTDMDTDNHFVKRVAGDPCPVLLRALEQLRQVRLQPIPACVFSVDTVISLFQCQEVVMHITQVIKHVAGSLVLRMLTYLIFVSSHGLTSYQSLTPEQWVGRHVTLRLRCSCLPTSLYIILHFRRNVKSFFTTKVWSFPRGRIFLPYLKAGVSNP